MCDCVCVCARAYMFMTDKPELGLWLLFSGRKKERIKEVKVLKGKRHAEEERV